MSSLKQPPPKFHHSEWVISNKMKYANAEGERAAAERLIAESIRAMDDSHKAMVSMRAQTAKRLDQRLEALNHWQNEEKDILAKIKDQIEALVLFCSRIDKAMEFQNEYLHIAQHCLATRSRRQGIDLVHDLAEKELIKEVEVLQGVLALMTRSREQAAEQLRLDRVSEYNLEKDLKNKMVAQGIDTHCKGMNERSKGRMLADPTVTTISGKSVSVDDWIAFTEGTILQAEKMRQKSMTLRGMLDQIMQASSYDLKRQFDSANEALLTRIRETRLAKEKLEEHIKYITQQIREMEQNIQELEKAIEEKVESLKLAHTRLLHRKERPGIELARDPAMYNLIQEVRDLEEMLVRLRERLYHSNCSLKGLDRKKQELEEDYAIKSDSLYIDDVELMSMRKSININCF